MTKKAQNLDPMNNIRKAAKDNDWTSLLVEYAANKAGFRRCIRGVKQPTTAQKKTILTL